MPPDATKRLSSRQSHLLCLSHFRSQPQPPTLTKAGDELEAMSFDASGSESEEGILDEEGPRQGNTGAAGGPVAPPRSPRTRRKRPGLVPPATVMASFAAMHELFRPPNAVGASPLTSAPNA